MTKDELKESIILDTSNTCKLPSTLDCGDEIYKFAEFRLTEGKKLAIVYENDVEYLVIGMCDRSRNVQFIKKTLKEEDGNIIHDVVTVKFSKPLSAHILHGKVDTGADICSIHCDDYKIVGDMVEFSCHHLSENIIKMPLLDKQAVNSSDGGVEYRPVIHMDVTIGDKYLNNVSFNLNDRSGMEYPVLVGKNALTRGNFLIKPRVSESEELTDEQLFAGLEVIEENDSELLTAITSILKNYKK
jgi:hypothetical protein